MKIRSLFGFLYVCTVALAGILGAEGRHMSISLRDAKEVIDAQVDSREFIYFGKELRLEDLAGEKVLPFEELLLHVARLAPEEQLAASLEKLTTRINSGSIVAPKIDALTALDEAHNLLVTYNDRITSDDELRSLNNQIAFYRTAIENDALTITVSSSLAEAARSPRPPLDTADAAATGNVDEAFSPIIASGFTLPDDVNVVHNLTVGNDLDIKGNLDITGTMTFHNDVALQPICPDTDIAVIFRDCTGGTEYARLYTPSTSLAGNGIALSTDGGTTEHFSVDQSGDSQFDGDLYITGVTYTDDGIDRSTASNLDIGSTNATDITIGGANVTGTLDIQGDTVNIATTMTAPGTVTIGTVGQTTIELPNGYITTGALPYLHNTGTNNFFAGVDAGADITTGSANVGVGYNALAANTTTSNNTAVGHSALTANIADGITAVGASALTANTTGYSNVAVGYTALTANTTGYSNTAVGHSALVANIAGVANTAVGHSALAANTAAASSNTAVGYETLKANLQTGNTAVGARALTANTTGTSNVAVGYTTLAANTTTSSNTAIGYEALTANIADGITAVGASALGSNTTGTGNVAVGYTALAANTTNSYSTAVGYEALAANTAAGNTAVGCNAGLAITTGGDNVFMGYGAAYQLTIGQRNTAIGRNSFSNATGAQSDNTAIGNSTLANATVDELTAVGSYALTSNTTGFGNVAVGYSALATNTTNSYSTAVGYEALAANTGAGNTALGYHALTTNITGTGNVAVGYSALAATTIANYNTAVGYGVLAANTGEGNTALGYQALASNISGYNNLALGVHSLLTNTSGYGNTAVGNQTLNPCTGNENTALGSAAGSALTTGSNNILIGFGAGVGYTTQSNNICIGGYPTNAADEKVIRIGNADSSVAMPMNACYIGGIRDINVGLGGATVYINADGQLGTGTSSIRYKENIDPLTSEERFMQLRPVTFTYKSDETHTLQFGLIAEEVEPLYPELIRYNNENEVEGVHYHLLDGIMISEIQKNRTLIAELRDELQNRIAALEMKLA